MTALLLASRACKEAAQPLSAAAGVGQILQDGFEFELGISIIQCIYQWAVSCGKYLIFQVSMLQT
jgi:hypothetical protein